MIKYKFPNNFLWGSATSGPQSEGAALCDGRNKSVWDYWYETQPEKFFDNVGPSDTSTFYKNYKQDIKLLKQTGHNSFRTSIQWSRLMPDSDQKINEKAVNFYTDMINCLIEEDIEPIINLYHFDMPLWAYKLGGWESKDVVYAYANYAKTCFKLFGKKVNYWLTFNEPMVPIEGGYLYGFHLPDIRDGKKAVQAAYNTQLASSLAIKEYKNLNLLGKIGIVINLTPTYPRSSDDKEDCNAADVCDLIFNRSFLDPSVLGKYPKKLIDIIEENDAIPVYTREELDIIKNNIIDFLGVNYYQPRRAKKRETSYDGPFLPEKYFESYQKPDAKMNPYRGWEIYEKGIYDICINIKDNYENIPFYISENGMGVEGESAPYQDQYRIDFVKEHLKWLHKGIKEGANCFGYHMWTFIDCWSWTNAYKNRYGFIALDLETQKRTIKKSGRWFKTLSKNNGF